MYRNLFLGFALDKQGKYEEAEQAYERATQSKPKDPQAWQGLIKLYEKQGSKKVDKYQNAATSLAVIYGELDDMYKCQDVIDKFTVFAKSQGTRTQHRKSLEIVLPSSPVYQFLEGRVPHPAHTYQTIAQITEAEEKERMNKEIGERRTRLGAKISQVTLEVKREIFSDSPLEEAYTKIIDWSNDDDIRRQYEEKLLQRCYDALLVAPATQQAEKRTKVKKLARDMVIIKHPFKLAWDVDIEWKDHPKIEEWDVNVLREYVDFFPGSGLGKVLKGYMTSEVCPFPPPPPAPKSESSDYSTDSDEEGGVMLSGGDASAERLMLMTEGMSEAGNSILAHRLMGEYYAFLEEHESVVETMRAALKLIAAEHFRTGITFSNSSQAIKALLGTALVYYQSPKNHPEARAIFEELLQQNPRSTKALIGTGLIFEEDEDYPSAIDFLERALRRAPDNVRVMAEAAWVKALNGDYETGRIGLMGCLDKMDPADLRMRDLRSETQYRIGMCIWHLDSSRSARKDRKGAYSYFLASLKSSMNFAPAYTILGIFYGDYTKDKKRARKCFQKAFELSASEVVAAERLARGFAADGDWELVEAVAQRVVDSGKVKPAPGSKKPGISWPFAALGVAELNKQDYTKSVASFQAALRISPNDYHCWVGLGESYHNSGRFIAATKAFTHALTFEEEVEKQKAGDTWFAKYMLANVKRELGAYDDAIERYLEVLAPRPSEFGVRMALQQTYVESAWDSVDKGLFGQAAERANKAIGEAVVLLNDGHHQAFNLWKCLGDACSVFSWVQDRLSEYDHKTMATLLLPTAGSDDGFELFRDIDGVSPDDLSADDLSEDKYLNSCLQASILTHKRSIAVSIFDIHAQAVAYYNLGWAEYRAHTQLRGSKKSSPYLKAAVRAFKRAIELESGNAEFWNALGVATSELSPKVAQHAFVRSLYLNERSAQVWVNYGTLALLQNDLQLASDAFTRAQSTDPDFGLAWVGQGIIQLMMGDAAEAQIHFTHALEISDSSSTLIKKQYVIATFDHILGIVGSTNIEDLVQPIFVLNQLSSMSPTELPYSHLSSLFLERVQNTLGAIAALEKVAGTAEADYEVSESPASLSRFALAKADLARSQLTAGQYEAAVESGELSLSLSEEDSGHELTPEQRQKCRLSAHLTVGLAHYHNGSPAEAVSFLDAALEEAKGNADAVCLLAQILWATGTQESKDKARDILFEAIETSPGHVQSVILLGTVSLLDNDTESLSAVTYDLQALRTSSNVTAAEQSSIGEILRAAAQVLSSSPNAALGEIQSDVFLFPNLPATWSRLAKLTGDKNAADMALRTAMMSAPPNGEAEVEDLAGALAGTGRAVDAQGAIMFAPWEKSGWNSLGEVKVPAKKSTVK